MNTTIRHAFMTCCALATLAGCATQQRMTLDEFAQRGAPVAEARADGDDRIACAGGVVTSEEEATQYAACEVIQGDLAITNTNLSSLGTFVNLREVRGTLRVTGNQKLKSVDGLQNLKAVRSLVISEAPLLESLTGLEGLNEVHGLVLHRTGAYTVAGLDNLARVGSLVVTDNPKLISLSALNGLTHAGRVHIESNPRLAGQLGLLPSLQTVERPMVLRSNVALSSGEISQLKTRGETLVAKASEEH